MDPLAADVIRRAYLIQRAAEARGDDDVEDLAALIGDLAMMYARGPPRQIRRAPGRFRGAIAGLLARALRAINDE